VNVSIRLDSSTKLTAFQVVALL